MATVTSSLKMYDAMTRPLKSITQSMNMMVSTMREMQSATNRNVNVDRQLIAAQRQIASAEADIRQSIEQAEREQRRFNRSMRDGTSAAFKLGAAIVVVNQGLQLFQNIWDKINRTMALADEITTVNARLGMVNDGLRTQTKLQQQVLDVANRTRSSYQATADLVSKLGLFTEGVFKNNDEMLAFAERFNKVLFAGGANAVSREIAVYQMSQALASGRLQGDELRSISEAAPALMKVLADGLGVSKGALKQLGAEGKLTADKIVKAFENQQKQIDKMFSQMPMTFGAATTILKNHFGQWVGSLNQVNGPLQNITTQVQRLTAYLQSPAGQNFLNGIAGGVAIAASSIVGLLGIITSVYNFIDSNWPTIEPIVWGIVGAMSAWLLLTRLSIAAQKIHAIATGTSTAAILLKAAATGKLTAAWRTLNAAQKANVFILIATLIAGLIVWLVRLWQTNDQFAAGLMRAWNAILNFFNRIPVYFWQLVEWLMTPFEWWAKSVGKIYDTVINGIIDGINYVLKLVNKITGSSYEISAKFNFENIAKGMKEYAKIKKTEAFANAEIKAAEREQRVLDFLDSRAAKRAEKANNQFGNAAASGYSMFSPNINRVNEVGRINDTVDISSEDLKMMRELAEMKNIQNFVTLTPTVQMSGDVHVKNESDIETIKQKIKESLEQEIASSAKGAYGV